MKARKIVLQLMCTLGLLLLAYWATWKLYYRNHSKLALDPYATETFYDRCLRAVFTPIERYEFYRFQRSAMSSCEGDWSGGRHWRGAVIASARDEIVVTVDGDKMRFSKAKQWPELQGQEFVIRRSEEFGGLLYISSGLGRITIIPQNTEARRSRHSDRIILTGDFCEGDVLLEGLNK